jgi:hypothetical protein
MHRRTNFAHGHFSESYLNRSLHASGVLVRFLQPLPDVRPFEREK